MNTTCREPQNESEWLDGGIAMLRALAASRYQQTVTIQPELARALMAEIESPNETTPPHCPSCECGIDPGPVETPEVSYEQFGWVPYHREKGVDAAALEEREEDRSDIIEGWEWVPAYAAVPALKATETPPAEKTNDCPACSIGNPGVYVKDGVMYCPHRPESPRDERPSNWMEEVSRLRGIANVCLAMNPTPESMRRALEQIEGSL